MLSRLSLFLLPRSFFATTSTQKLFTQRIDRLVQVIHSQLKPSFLRVKDISNKTIDDDQMIQVEVQSQLFRNKPKLDQHRMVIACFGEDIQDFHAFLIKTRIPLKQNVVIGKPEEQILHQELNVEGNIPNEVIKQVIGQFEEEKEEIKAEVKAEVKVQKDRKEGKEREEKVNKTDDKQK